MRPIRLSECWYGEYHHDMYNEYLDVWTVYDRHDRWVVLIYHRQARSQSVRYHPKHVTAFFINPF